MGNCVSNRTAPENRRRKKHRHPKKKESSAVKQSPNLGQPPSSFYCRICMENKNPSERFAVAGCRHDFCCECIRWHVSAKVKLHSSRVQCPGGYCGGEVELLSAIPILPREVADRWGDILCESLIPENIRFYCPHKDCSALLLDDRGEEEKCEMKLRCPHCGRFFCGRCNAQWQLHDRFTCDELMQLKIHENEDMMFIHLSEMNRWQKCPRCRLTVEKISGCNEVRCKCGRRFCYACGRDLPCNCSAHGV